MTGNTENVRNINGWACSRSQSPVSDEEELLGSQPVQKLVASS